MTHRPAKYSTDIDIKFGDLTPMIAWCTHNTVGEWWYTVLASAGEWAGSYTFNFDNKTDYINFILWKK